MSPFSIFLKQLRLSRGYKQKELAELLGFESSYLSSLERSEKGPPRQDFIQRLIRGLELNEAEQVELARALQASRRQVSLPARASEREYALLHQLEPQLGNLAPLQIQLIELALQIPKPISTLDRFVRAKAVI
ncbi:helix-turn-helix domain-containing protein [Azonexus sp. IMCC34839]|uniref:helix-turn-helix domain-containing protein n=1 Tax=Azonexus sp. IMCC34839 TaxID=3133695 RepID=UPI00399BFC9D